MADEVRAKANKLLERLADAAEKLITLDVVTVIGEVVGPERSAAGEETFNWDAKDGSEVFRTQIDLIQGDIRNVLPLAHAGEDGSSARAFHNEQVVKAQQIIADNLKALTEFARDLRNAAG